jgi:hypothetical protein
MEGQPPPLPLGTKICTHCKGDPQPLDAFSPCKASRDGLASWCKACVNEAVRAWSGTKRGKALRRISSAAYQGTERGKLVHYRAKLRRNLAQARTEKRRLRIIAKLSEYDAEITRLDQVKVEENGRKPAPTQFRSRAGLGLHKGDETRIARRIRAAHAAKEREESSS